VSPIPQCLSLDVRDQPFQGLWHYYWLSSKVSTRMSFSDRRYGFRYIGDRGSVAGRGGRARLNYMGWNPSQRK